MANTDDGVGLRPGDGAGEARVQDRRIQPAQGRSRHRQVHPLLHLHRRRLRLVRPLLPRRDLQGNRRWNV
ncbi:hypothetical protein ACP70R_003263 [Stipagrostis hirtigluma subsp. patula]